MLSIVVCRVLLGLLGRSVFVVATGLLVCALCVVLLVCVVRWSLLVVGCCFMVDGYVSLCVFGCWL